MNISTESLSTSISNAKGTVSIVSVILLSLENINEDNYDMLSNSLTGICGISDIPSLEDFSSPLTIKQSSTVLTASAVDKIKNDLVNILYLATSVIERQKIYNGKLSNGIAEVNDQLVVNLALLKEKISTNSILINNNNALHNSIETVKLYKGEHYGSSAYLELIIGNCTNNIRKINNMFNMLFKTLYMYNNTIKALKDYIEANVYPETPISSIVSEIEVKIKTNLEMLTLSMCSEMEGFVSDGYVITELKPIMAYCKNRLEICIEGTPVAHSDITYEETMDTSRYIDDISDVERLVTITEGLIDPVVSDFKAYDKSKILDTIKESMEITIGCGREILNRTKSEDCVNELKIVSLLIIPLETLSMFTTVGKWLIDNEYKNRVCLEDTLKCLNTYCVNAAEA